MRTRHHVALVVLLPVILGSLPIVSLDPPRDVPNADPPREVRQGDWLITSLVVLRNTTLVMDGNITVAAGGHLRLENATLVMNSTYELQYSIGILSGGAFTAVDLDGDNTTSADASNVTAGQRGNMDPLSQDDYFHYAFRVRSGATLTILNSEVREVGSHSLPPWDSGIYIEASDVLVSRSRFSGNFETLYLPGDPMGPSQDIVIDGNTFSGNVYSINGGGRGLVIRGNLFDQDPMILGGTDLVFSSNVLLESSVSLHCYGNCTLEGNYWRTNPGLAISDSRDLVLRNETIVGVGPSGGGIGFIQRSTNVTVENIRVWGANVGVRLLRTNMTLRGSVFIGESAYLLAEDQSHLSIVNSSILGTMNNSIRLTADSHISLLNSTVDRTRTEYSDPASTMTVSWFLNAKVEDIVGRPIIGARVEIRNLTAAILASGITGSQGRLSWVVAREYDQRDLNGDRDGLDPSETVYDTPHNVTATFQGFTANAEPEPLMNMSREVVLRLPASLESVTITRSPESGQVVVDNAWYAAPATFSWLSGTTHAVEALAVDEYVPGSRYAFMAWSDGGARAHAVVVSAGGGAYVASYRTQHRPMVTATGTDGHPVRIAYVANGTAATGLAAPTWSDWVDESSALTPSPESEGGTASERWVTDVSFTAPPWSSVDATFAETVVYTHQFSVRITIEGLPAASPAALAFVRFGVATSGTSNASFDEWADAGTPASTDAQIPVGARERYRTVDPVSWTVDAPMDATIHYRRQFLHNVVLDGTNAAHLVSISFTLDGAIRATPEYGTWTDWSDAVTTLSVSVETTGDPPRTTDDPTSWTADAPLDVLVRYLEPSPPPPPPPQREANWKPVLALAFSLTILVAALIRRRRGADRRTLLLHVPFLTLEAGIGVASWATGVLSVPPWLGAGTIVNAAILLAGLLFPAWRRGSGRVSASGK